MNLERLFTTYLRLARAHLQIGIVVFVQICRIDKLCAAKIAHAQLVFCHAPILVYVLDQRRVIREILLAVFAFVRADNGMAFDVFVSIRRLVEHRVANVALELVVFGEQVRVHVRLLFVYGTERHAAVVIVAFVAVRSKNAFAVVCAARRCSKI